MGNLAECELNLLKVVADRPKMRTIEWFSIFHFDNRMPQTEAVVNRLIADGYLMPWKPHLTATSKGIFFVKGADVDGNAIKQLIYDSIKDGLNHWSAIQKSHSILTRNQFQYHAKEMREAGIIKLEGSRRGARYYIVDQKWSSGAKKPVKPKSAKVSKRNPVEAPVKATGTKVASGVKYDGDKPRFDLLPHEPVQEVAKVLTFGAKKYAPDNWKKVEGWKWRYYGAAFRHLFAYWMGESDDQESGLHHLAHAVCCILFLLDFELKGVGHERSGV